MYKRWASVCFGVMLDWPAPCSSFLQLEYFCSPFCVSWARQCSRWAPILKGLHICCHWCSQADCFLDQEMDLWPVRSTHKNPCLFICNSVSELFLLFVSCPEPDHSLLVQREGAGTGFRSDSGFLSTWVRPELLPHPEVWRKIWHAVDSLGR